jgi:hypothetical protein
MDLFKIRGTDQQEYGPVDASRLRQWIAERRAHARTQVRREGAQDWVPLGSIAEFQDALAGEPAAAPDALTGAPRKGMAIASLVLGVLSLLCLSVLAGIPAILAGHIARLRARRRPEEYGGAGLALGGLVLGYLSGAIALLLVGAGLLLFPRAHTQAQNKVQSVQCASNLKQLGVAARLWASDNGDRLPPDFLSMSNELSSPIMLACPAAPRRSRMTHWSQFNPVNVTYEYLQPGGDVGQARNQTVFRCPIHGHCALGDGSVRESR